MSSETSLKEKLDAFVGKQIGPPVPAPIPVNEAMIRIWCEALGDRNPIYTDAAAAQSTVHKGIVAPPTMLQAWILPGFEMAQPVEGGPRDKQEEIHKLLTENGYNGVVATNCEQTFHRYLRPGDKLSASTVIRSVSPEKATALGIGHFIETVTTFRDQKGQAVAEMMFRVLKFKAAQQPKPAEPAAAGAAPAKPKRLRPPIGHDNAWWWDAVKDGKLPIQRCKKCGVLRHPPRPMCGECQSTEWDSIVSSGKGTVNSFVVLHYPMFPGYDYPLIAAVVDLEEGTRLVSNIVGIEPAKVKIGMKVQTKIEAVDDEMKLPLFHPAA